jgi:hypothetical protein
MEQKDCYGIHNSTALVPILSKTDPVHVANPRLEDPF